MGRSLISLQHLTYVLIFCGLTFGADPVLADSKQTPLTATPTYEALPGYKASAVYTADPNTPYTVHSLQNKLAAANMALRTCEQAHPTFNNQAHCELVRVDDTTITSSATLKERVPSTAHPLYLWRYQSSVATVYLAGSVHILKQGLYPLAKPYQEAFDASQTLVLEIDISALTPQELQAKSMQYATLAGPSGLSEILPMPMYQRFAAAAADYGLPLPQLERFKPAFLTQQLSVLAMLALGYDPEQGVEKHFMQQLGGREVLELESIDFQLDLLLNQPLETQLAILEDTLNQLSELEVLTADLMTAWLSGDDPAFARLFELQSGSSDAVKAFMEALMDERNVGMADKIAGYLQTPGSYFVLVGSGHFVGNDNVIELLKHKGLEGTRIYSNQTLGQ